jgi:D-alanyl-D-alanine dipeptidase
MRRFFWIFLSVSVFFSCKKKTANFPVIKLQKQISIKNISDGYDLKSIKEPSALQLIFSQSKVQSKKGRTPFYLYFNKKIKLKSLIIKNTQNASSKFKLYLNEIYTGKYNVGKPIIIHKKVKSLKILFLCKEKQIHSWTNDTIIILTKEKKIHPHFKISLNISTKNTVRIHVRRKRISKTKHIDNQQFTQEHFKNKNLITNGLFYKKTEKSETKFSIYFSLKNTFVIYQISEHIRNKKINREIFFIGYWQSKKINNNLFSLELSGKLSGYFSNAKQKYISNNDVSINAILINNTLYFKKILQPVYLDFPENALVNVQELIPAVKVKLAYASNQNFTKTKLYPCNKCFIRYKVAKALLNAQKELEEKGMSLIFYDCYRPYAVQKLMFEKFPIKGYVASPVGGSIHNRGLAVDLSIVDKKGKELDMGTGFDELSRKANHTYTGFPDTILNNRLFLKNLMIKYGFSPIRSEWWHYNFRPTHQYPVINDDFLCD